MSKDFLLISGTFRENQFFIASTLREKSFRRFSPFHVFFQLRRVCTLALDIYYYTLHVLMRWYKHMVGSNDLL